MKCAFCNKVPEEIPEYVGLAAENELGSADEAVKQLEGAYHYGYELFLCTSCYIKLGQPLRSEVFGMYQQQKVTGV